MIRPALCATFLLAAPAHAELTLCNRMSYVVDAAIGLERAMNVSTRGWFRIDPGQCKRVYDDVLDADLVYVHARTPDLYGTAPEPRAAQAELCVGDNTFVIPNARGGCRPTLPFSAIKPSDSDKGPRANLAEEADYDDTQARLAGIQRLLVIAGYDANPIDGVAGSKTAAALSKFLKDRNLPAEAANADNFFALLLKAAESPEGAGFAWCNDTSFPVMAAVGTNETNGILARGWYRVEPGRCLRPDLRGEPARVYSYGEAVGNDGQAIKRGDRPLVWGGTTELCTREGKFEVSDHKDCKTRGLNPVGFAAVDVKGATTVRFRE